MITPPPLKIGDKVGITATARKITLDEIAPAIALLETWGLVPVIGTTIGSSLNQFSADDLSRAKDLTAFLQDESIKAVWCARGGYGTFRMVDMVEWKWLKKYPKWIIGYSDITVLHSHLFRLGIKSIHATMPINVSNNTPQALSSLYNVLFDPMPEANYRWPANPLNRQGQGKGRLVGGNLSVLYSIAGSRSEADWKNTVLFLEDLDEYLYHIDRMMLNLQKRGVLAQLSGMVVGGMTDMRDNTIPFGKSAYEIVADHVAEYSYPVAYDFPAGHISNNTALQIGQQVHLQCEAAHAHLGTHTITKYSGNIN